MKMLMRKYIGLNIHTVRDEIIKDLEDDGVFVEKVKYKNTVPIGERTGETIEPLLTNPMVYGYDRVGK